MWRTTQLLQQTLKYMLIAVKTEVWKNCVIYLNFGLTQLVKTPTDNQQSVFQLAISKGFNNFNVSVTDVALLPVILFFYFETFFPTNLIAKRDMITKRVIIESTTDDFKTFRFIILLHLTL